MIWSPQIQALGKLILLMLVFNSWMRSFILTAYSRNLLMEAKLSAWCWLLVARAGLPSKSSHTNFTLHKKWANNAKLMSCPTLAQSSYIAKLLMQMIMIMRLRHFRIQLPGHQCMSAHIHFGGILQIILAEIYDFTHMFGPPILGDTRPTHGYITAKTKYFV